MCSRQIYQGHKETDINLTSVTIDCRALIVTAIYVCFRILMEAVGFKVPVSCVAELERWVGAEAGEWRKIKEGPLDETCILSCEIII